MTGKRAFKKPSIRDVARLADVSVTTVSHVVSQTPGYSAETIKKVRDAIDALNYVPSYAANGLRQRSTRTIGVCAIDPFETDDRDLATFSDRLWSGILKEADDNHYKVMHFPRSIRDSHDAGEFLNGQIDGLIICASRFDNRPATAARAGLPVIMVARSYDVPEGIVSVAIDERQVVRLGLEHLRSLGHRRIAYVAGPAQEATGEDGHSSSDDVARARLEAYLEWMGEHVTDFPPVYVATTNWKEADFRPVLRSWMEHLRPTAVMVCSDSLARGLVHDAIGLGIQVPVDLSVIGIDNERESARLDPPLTSIEVPIQWVGRMAVRRLLERLGDDALPLESLAPDVRVFVRRSTAPAREIA
jgi:LacI family transcriptional regulator